MRVRFQYQSLQRRVFELKDFLYGQIPEDLRRAGEAAAARIDNFDDATLRRYIAGQVWRDFNAVFVGVRLKHKRPEMWPDLWPIYVARIVRKQKTWRGRRRFFVDESKLAALHARVVAQRLARERRLKRARWEIEVLRVPRGNGWIYRLVMRKRGTLREGQREHAITLVREQLREFTAETLTDGLRRVGLT